MLFSPGWRGPVRQGGVLAVFGAGLAAGGALTAAVLWLLSGLAAPLPPRAAAAAALCCAGLGVVRETGLVRVPLPQNARQVPAGVLRHLLRGTLRFGFELGTGVRTYVPSAVPYVVAAALLLTRPQTAAFLAAGTGFGAGRALTAALGYAARRPGWQRRVDARLPWVTAGTSLAVFAALAVQAVTAAR